MQKIADGNSSAFLFQTAVNSRKFCFFLGIYILFFILYNIFVFCIGARTREQ